MKKIAINLVLLMFTFNQALAYAPSAEDIEISKALDSLSKELDASDFAQTKSVGESKQISERKFNRLKRKSLRKLNHELNTISKLTPESQEIYFENKIKKQFRKSRKVVSKLERRKRLLSKIARKSKTTPEALMATMKDSSTVGSEEKAISEIKEAAIQHGGYEGLLLEQIKKAQDAQYFGHLNSTASKGKTRKGGRSIASETPIDWIFTGLGHLFVAILFLGPISIVLGAIVLLIGGPASLLFAGLGGTFLVYGLIINWASNI